MYVIWIMTNIRIARSRRRASDPDAVTHCSDALVWGIYGVGVTIIIIIIIIIIMLMSHMKSIVSKCKRTHDNIDPTLQQQIDR